MDILEVLEMGRKLGETQMLLKAAEKTARKAARGGRFWKLVAVAEAGLIFAYLMSNKKEKEKEETDIVQESFFDDFESEDVI